MSLVASLKVCTCTCTCTRPYLCMRWILIRMSVWSSAYSEVSPIHQVSNGQKYRLLVLNTRTVVNAAWTCWCWKHPNKGTWKLLHCIACRRCWLLTEQSLNNLNFSRLTLLGPFWQSRQAPPLVLFTTGLTSSQHNKSCHEVPSAIYCTMSSVSC